MFRHVDVWGFEQKKNDVIFCGHPKPASCNVIYFPGDVQDRRAVNKALKEASEAIKAKDFRRADDLTSRILMFDGSNANANVFRGLCREESGDLEEALRCYKMAVDNKPDALLGWQALATFYEKRSDARYKDDLCSVYEKLCSLLAGNEAMKKKRDGILLSRVLILNEQRRYEEIEALVTLELATIESQDVAFQLRLTLEEVLTGSSKEEALEELRERLIFQDSGLFEDSEVLLKMMDRYIKSLKNTSVNPETLHKKCLDILLIFPDHKLALEIVILYQLEVMLLQCYLQPEVSELKGRIQRLNNEHPFREILRCLEFWRGGEIERALEVIWNPSTNIINDWVIVFLLRARLGLLLHRMDVCRSARIVPSISKSILPRHVIVQEIQFSHWSCCSRSGDAGLVHGALVDMKKQLDIREEKPKFRILFIRLSLLDGRLTEGREMMDSFDDEDVEETLLLELDICRSILHYGEGNYNEAIECVYSLCDPDALVCKGKAQWKLEDWDAAKSSFDSALQMDPSAWEAYLYVGYFYAQARSSRESRRAFEKAFKLRKNEATGIAFCDLLFKRKKYDKSLEILDQVTRQSASNLYWAWFRKGNIFMAMDKIREAVFAFEKASSYEETAVVFECLGDANSRGGSFETAVKNYKRALTIDESREYSRIRVASLSRTLGDYEVAVVEYLKVLTVDSHINKVNGYKGIGDTYISLAMASVNQQLVKLAVEQVEKAILYLTQGVCLAPHLLSMVRSLADACVVLYDVSDSCLKLRIPVTLNEGSFANGFSDETTEVEKEELMELSNKLYASALSLKEDCAETWCCLAFSLLQSYFLKNERSLLVEAEVCVKRALEINDKDSAFWNLLGVLYSIEKASIFQAQHCFIQALKIDSDNALAWSNLGFLYLMEDKIELAHKVFSRAQCEDPALALPWLGQGRIALLVDNTKEALDLFRHSSVLGHTTFGAVVYSRLLLHFAHNPEIRETRWYRDTITNLCPNAQVLSNDALERSLQLNPLNRECLHIMALLQDKLGNERMAISYMKRCLAIDDGSNSNLRQNALRILEFGQEGCGVSLPPGEPKSVIQLLIRAYFEASRGNLQEGNEYYERAAVETNNALERSQISAAMAFHAFQAGDVDAATESLLQSAQEDEVAPESILGLAAIAALNQDDELASSLTDELADMADNPHAVYLHAVLLKLTDGYDAGLRHLEIAVFRRPHEAKLWHYLTRYVSSRPDDLNAGPISASCSQVAHALVPTSRAHARLLLDVYGKFGDFLDRGMERIVCNLYRIYPTDRAACASIATVAKRRIDHAERGAVKILQEFSRTLRNRVR